jgi:calcium-binding protein CML
MENFTTSKLEDLRIAFNLFDLDGDGRISRDELKQCLKIINDDWSEDEIDEIIHNINPDDDYIEFHHFLILFNDKKEYKCDDALFDAFKIFGKKNNGNITLEQMKYLICNFCVTLSAEEKEQLINVLQLECEDSINFENFCKILRLR